MYSLLVCCNVNNTPINFVLEKSSTITKMVMPSLGIEIDTSYRVIPEIGGGWFYIAPRSRSKKLISEFSDNELSILLYGELFQSKYKNHAKYIRDIYKSKDIDSVRQLDGCFSVIVFDLNRSKIYVICDITGRRSLRYLYNGQSIFISSHDIPIIATGFCEINFNFDSACSILSFDWSLQGKSLMRNIKSIHPNEYILCNKEDVRIIYKPLLNLRDRLDPKDIVGHNTQIDLMIENILNYTRCICEGETIVEADLTAGIDSRALVAIMLAISDASKLKLCTAGEDNCLDVRIASRIAELYGTQYSNSIPDTPEIDIFLNYSKLLAFFMNGDTNSKRAVDSLPQINHYYPPHFKGLGGEIYRGYYYPSKNDYWLNNLNPNDVIRILQRKFSRVDVLPWLCKDSCETVKQSLKEIIYCYYDISQQGSDLIDLFYLYERFGRWGSLDTRGTWFQHYFSPFGNPALVKMAFKFPAPIGSSHQLHKAIITRFVPKLYHWPINNKDFLAFSGPSSIKRFGKFICHGLNFSYRNASTILPHGNRPRSHDDVRSDYFADALGGVLYDILLKNNSFGITLFGRTETEKIIHDHISRNANYLNIIGFLLTIEHWSYLVTQAYKLANEINSYPLLRSFALYTAESHCI